MSKDWSVDNQVDIPSTVLWYIEFDDVELKTAG